MDPIPTPSASARYWREVFADGVELMQLPLQRNRPPVPSFLRDTVTTRINAGTQAELQRRIVQIDCVDRVVRLVDRAQRRRLASRRSR